jgi:hypothetical protein
MNRFCGGLEPYLFPLERGLKGCVLSFIIKKNSQILKRKHFLIIVYLLIITSNKE